MNSTSPSRLVSRPARSAAFSMVGPWARRLPPIALAMILARVVLPSPGGPAADRRLLALLGGCDSDLERSALCPARQTDQPPAAASFKRCVGRAQFIRDPRGHRRESEAQRKGRQGDSINSLLDIVLRPVMLAA